MITSKALTYLPGIRPKPNPLLPISWPQRLAPFLIPHGFRVVHHDLTHLGASKHQVRSCKSGIQSAFGHRTTDKAPEVQMGILID